MKRYRNEGEKRSRVKRAAQRKIGEKKAAKYGKYW